MRVEPTSDPSGRRVSVVVPMHRTGATLAELADRLRAVLPGVELVLVDDACPDGSAGLARQHVAGPARLVELDRNVGQHAAVLLGLAAATGDVVVVMDADLQDRPEDVPVLLEVLADRGHGGAVCAQRRGRYAGVGRRTSALAFRALQRAASRRRIPPDAGMFCALDQRAVASVLALGDPVAPLVAALAAAAVPIDGVPLQRRARPTGRSAFTSRRRLLVAWRSALVLSPARGLVAARHRRAWSDPVAAVTDLHPDADRAGARTP